MRKDRLIEQNRCYHLISRLAHRAFFRDDMEKDRAVSLMRRVGFSRYCMTGLMEMGLVARTDPDNLMSSRREYYINYTMSISSDPLLSFAPGVYDGYGDQEIRARAVEPNAVYYVELDWASPGCQYSKEPYGPKSK